LWEVIPQAINRLGGLVVPPGIRGPPTIFFTAARKDGACDGGEPNRFAFVHAPVSFGGGALAAAFRDVVSRDKRQATSSGLAVFTSVTLKSRRSSSFMRGVL